MPSSKYASLAIYPLSSKTVKHKNNNITCGKNEIIEPTPPNIPPTNNECMKFIPIASIALIIGTLIAFNNHSNFSLIYAPTLPNVMQNTISTINKNIGIAKYLFKKTLSKTKLISFLLLFFSFLLFTFFFVCIFSLKSFNILFLSVKLFLFCFVCSFVNILSLFSFLFIVCSLSSFIFNILLFSFCKFLYLFPLALSLFKIKFFVFVLSFLFSNEFKLLLFIIKLYLFNLKLLLIFFNFLQLILFIDWLFK